MFEVELGAAAPDWFEEGPDRVDLTNSKLAAEELAPEAMCLGPVSEGDSGLDFQSVTEPTLYFLNNYKHEPQIEHHLCGLPSCPESIASPVEPALDLALEPMRKH